MAKRKPSSSGRRATNIDLSDREFLANIQDAIGADGWATTTEVAIACGFTGNGKKGHTPAVKVASRLVAMRNGQLIESTEPDPESRPTHEPGSRDMRWRPTEAGEMILGGRLSKAVMSAIDRMNPGAQVLMMRQLSQQGWVGGNIPTAFAIRREWQHNQAQRRLILR